uniref:cell division cycle protein 27 homolog isoform X2 n=1 Tax=Myxine glutinosa TaxID=7769 RepID=UPI00358EAA14
MGSFEGRCSECRCELRVRDTNLQLTQLHFLFSTSQERLDVMTVLQEPVQAAIWHALNHYAYRDAVFLAERLYAEVVTDDVLYLLATCYFRSSKPYRAYNLLKAHSWTSAQCRFLLAKCCLEMGKLSEAEQVVAGGILGRIRTTDEIVADFGDAACFSLAMLGQIYCKTDRGAKGAECFQKSLTLNPFLWTSFESLCENGQNPDPEQLFRLSATQNLNFCQSNYPLMCGTASNAADTTQETIELNRINLEASSIAKHPLHTPATSASVIDTTLSSAESFTLLTGSTFSSRPVRTRPRSGRSLLGGSSISPLTPSFGVLPLDSPNPGEQSGIPGLSTGSSVLDSNLVPNPKKALGRLNTGGMKPMFGQSGNGREGLSPLSESQSSTPQSSTTQVLIPTSGVPPNSLTNAPPRRSTRLFISASSTAKENNKKPKLKFSSPSKALARKTKSRNNKDGVQPVLGEGHEGKADSGTVAEKTGQTASMQRAAAESLLAILRDLGKAYRALCAYDCREAVRLFEQLPPQHYRTGWVLSQHGRAHFELADYSQAEKVFGELRYLDPRYMEGMEIYSTTLWHLQRDVALSALAQELTEMDLNSPQAWCVAGNCYSLQREHDVAIKFFKRAVQVDPTFAYAYTLLGHELVLTEELDKALPCFRNAVRISPRHYNAWYGLGLIYFKQEKCVLAEVHFRKALSINPQNSVLLCHVGVVQHAQKKTEAALETFTKAIELDPKNPLCKFHRASVLFSIEKYKAALEELDELKEIVPKESLVYFLIGKVYKKLGLTHLALMNFSWAMDLDPKGVNNQIKEAIDKRYLPDDEEFAGEMDIESAFFSRSL